MISSQYGTVFTQSHYERIKKVCSIWVCASPPKERENTITGYSVAERNYVGNVKEFPGNYDLLTAIMICLGAPEGEGSEGILKLLNVLLSSEIEPEDKRRVLEHDFKIPMTEVLERQVFEMCNLSKGVEEKGIKKGIEKGMEKGTEIAELSAIENLMQKLKMSAEQAMETLDIAIDKRARYHTMIGK